MDVQQAQQLTEEALALCEQLAAGAAEARWDDRFQAAARISTIRGQAVRRSMRRLNAWAVAACGHGVMA